MSMTNVLKMVFANSAGKKTTWTLADPKVDLTKVQVATVMNSAIAKSIPVVNNDPDNVDVDDAWIYQTEKIELA